MTGSVPPRRLIALASVDSTNAEAMRLAAAGETGPLWIAAERQTSGRGRSGRQWASEPGNLQASLLVCLRQPAPKSYQLSLVAGIAAIDAIRAAMALPPEAGLRLKWPNDILIAGSKAGGILVEATSGAAGTTAVVGFGINIARHPADLDRPATHLAAHGAAPSPKVLLDAIAGAMEHWLEVWQEGHGFDLVRSAWVARAGAIGERIRINTGAGVAEGCYWGIDEEGALVMRDSGGVERHFSFGDVALSG